MRYTYALAAIAAATAFATPASAQFATDSTASIDANALLLQPATLQRVDNLNFGTIVATPTATGVVSVDPVSGLRTVAAPLTGSSTDAGGRGRFVGNGLPGAVVNLRVSFPSFLNNVQDATRTVAFSGQLDPASATLARTIGATGVFYVDVGGSITIAVGQMPGQYTGTVTLDADFQ